MEVQRVSRTSTDKIKSKDNLPAESISFQEVISKNRQQA
ncbi:DUF327 domain-containing protein, partial [Bacillus circulans]|nr:DUF327 domain-containing protein [Niallia circulans]